ncbi:hypothetical protein KIW84_062466 [Lathyrus oleraceus]|uniref:CCHC-type domain-containing protein n=1 Tax=Pisum sativum TaxID=3888 RepID=A0A9D4W767_PEA|nr:hypothetical protein KIW84_062466 [Pisum sativum]
MELNGDEPVRKSKSLALKFVAKAAKTPQVWESEEASRVEGSKDDSNDEVMNFIVKREKKGDHKGCFNFNKPGHFIVECPELQKEKSKKGSFQKDNFRNKFKKSPMETWDELDNEEDYEG